MCVGEILCHFMCTMCNTLLEAFPCIYSTRLPSTFMCHIFFEEYSKHSHTHLRSQYTSCSTKYIYCGTHIFVVCVCAGRELLFSSPFRSPHFPAGYFHLTPPPPRNAIVCLQCMFVIWNGWQKWTFQESKKAITQLYNNSTNDNHVKMRVHAIETTKYLIL